MESCSTDDAPIRHTLHDDVVNLYKLIGHTRELTIRAHVLAIRTLDSVRMHLARRNVPDSKHSVLLLCSGTAIERRRLLLDQADETSADLLRTSVLVFVTICMIERTRRGALGVDELNRHRATLRIFDGLSLWRRLVPDDDTHHRSYHVTKKQSEPPSTSSTHTAEDRDVTSVAPPTDSDVAFASLCLGVAHLQDDSLESVQKMSGSFYRHTARQMALSHLQGAGDNFLSLSSGVFCDSVSTEGSSEADLRALISAGESEAGQQVMRDMILSFILPSSLVGIRKTLLLPRAVAQRATIEHTEMVQFAHETAMEGVEWTWEHSKDPLKLMCALMTSVACLTTTEGEDPIRKAEAFAGRVQLPFLHTHAPPDKHQRVALVPSLNQWVLFHISNSEPVVHTAVEGLTGARLALLGLSKTL